MTAAIAHRRPASHPAPSVARLRHLKRWLVAYYCAGALSLTEAEAIARRMRERHAGWRTA